MIIHNHPEVITDWREVLCLLCPKWDDNTDRMITTVDPSNPTVVITVRGGLRNTAFIQKRFPTTTQAVHELLERGLISNSPQPEKVDAGGCRITETGAREYRTVVRDDLLREALDKLRNTGFDHLCEIQVRNRICHVLTADLSDNRVRILYAIERELRSTGFIRRLESVDCPDGWRAHRCEITDAGYQFMRHR